MFNALLIMFRKQFLSDKHHSWHNYPVDWVGQIFRIAFTKHILSICQIYWVFIINNKKYIYNRTFTLHSLHFIQSNTFHRSKNKTHHTVPNSTISHSNSQSEENTLSQLCNCWVGIVVHCWMIAIIINVYVSVCFFPINIFFVLLIFWHNQLTIVCVWRQ